LGNVRNPMPRPRKPKEKRKVGLAIYLEPKVLQLLRATAEKDRRSLSDQGAIYIERGLGLSP
jgi:hypothetical protein